MNMKKIVATVLLTFYCCSQMNSINFAKTINVDKNPIMTFIGTIHKHKATAANGKKYTTYDLVLAKKQKFKSEWWGTTTEKRIMLNNANLSSKYKKLLKEKKKVKVTGEVIVGQTGWYCEDYAVLVKEVIALKR